MHISIEIPRKIALAYSAACKPICRKLDLPQTAFDILMFLGNNPEYRTASEIVELRHIKANLVSINVEKLAQDGYLERRQVRGDRRKTELILTERAQPVIDQGRALQKGFFEGLFSGINESDRAAFFAALQKIEDNINAMWEAEAQ